MSTKMTMEQRVAVLEKKIAQMEERRARIVPPEIDGDANVQELMADMMKNAVERWKSSLAAHGVAIKEARKREMMALKLRELEEQGKLERQRLEAEILAVLAYYEKHGRLPEGCDYEIVDDGMAPVNARIF